MPIVLIFALLAFLPILVTHFVALWNYSQSQFFPILLVAITVIVAERGWRIRDLQIPIGRLQWPAVLCFFAGLAILLLGVLVGTPNVAMFASMVFTAGIVWQLSYAGGADRDAKLGLWGPWALGWFMVQLPGFAERNITRSLQLFSSSVSSRFLDWIGINHLLTGNVLRLDSRSLFVDEACSGVISLFSILAFGAMFAVWQRYSAIRAVLLMIIGVGFTILLNVMRISIIAIADQWYQIDLAEGMPHTLLGVGLFGVTLAGFYCSDQVLGQFLSPIPERSLSGRRLTPIEKFWNRMTANQDITLPPSAPINADVSSSRSGAMVRGVLIAFSIAILTLWVGRRVAMVNRDIANSNSGTIVAGLDAGLLEQMNFKSGAFDQVERARDDPAGAFSTVFVDKERGGLSCSIDYPFYGRWHELTNCYEVTGWSIESRKVIQSPDGDYVEARFKNPQGEFGYLLFSFVDIEGNHVSSADTSDWIGWTLFELRRRITNGFSDEVIQIQLWDASAMEMSEEVVRDLREEFKEFRSVAKKKMFTPSM